MADPEIREAGSQLVRCPCTKYPKNIYIHVSEVMSEKKKIYTFYNMSCGNGCGRRSVAAKTLASAVKKWNGMIGCN